MKPLPELSAAKRATLACIAGLMLGACQSLAPDRAAPLSQELAESIRTIASPITTEQQRRQAAAVYRQRLAATFPDRLAESTDPGPAVQRALPGRPRTGIADPAGFADLTPVRRPRETRPGLHHEGLGRPVVGRIAPDGHPNAPRAGFKVPLTLLALPPEAAGACCDSALINPRRTASLATGQGELPVAMETALRTADGTGPRRDGWAGSDGVVPYTSSHLRLAESELVVPAGHGGFDHPLAVAKLKRILRRELAQEAQLRRCGRGRCSARRASSGVFATTAIRSRRPRAHPGCGPSARLAGR